MTDIVTYSHKYVPGHNENCPESTPVKVLSGGNYLTFERHKEAQSAMQDARTPSSRLEGLIPKIEDFHTQMEWMEVIINFLSTPIFLLFLYFNTRKFELSREIAVRTIFVVITCNAYCFLFLV